MFCFPLSPANTTLAKVEHWHNALLEIGGVGVLLFPYSTDNFPVKVGHQTPVLLHLSRCTNPSQSADTTCWGKWSTTCFCQAGARRSAPHSSYAKTILQGNWNDASHVHGLWKVEWKINSLFAQLSWKPCRFSVFGLSRTKLSTRLSIGRPLFFPSFG